MTRSAYLDAFSGVSGNMFLAAILDAGASPAAVRAAVSRVVRGFKLQVTEEKRGHLGGLHLRVLYPKANQPERRLQDIARMIRNSGLPEEVREKSRAVFQRLAAAEAQAHRRKISEVHFHEVGAVDAIVDVVGAVYGLFTLGIREIICSPLPLGRGQVECAHGTLPLPAPAVLELLRGVPVVGVEEDAELVTPTGAALAVTLARSFGPLPAMRIEKIGVGLGSRDLPGRPNLLRLIVGEQSGEGDEAIQLEAAIDDMPAEHFDFLMDKLHSAGAVEVLLIPAQMKKNRPGTLVRALTPPENRAAVLEALFTHSTTLGVRAYAVSRTLLPREIFPVLTRYGKIRVKAARGPRGELQYHAEYDDLQRAAAKAGVSLAQAQREVEKHLRNRNGRRPRD